MASSTCVCQWSIVRPKSGHVLTGLAECVSVPREDLPEMNGERSIGRKLLFLINLPPDWMHP